jgi:hypothetical protein
MKRILALLATAGLLSGSLDANAAASNYSDTWWNPQEIGTGLQLVQQGETAFVTLYTYGSNGEPLWFVASDAHVYAYTSAGRPAFRGTLYRTRGTPFSSAHRNADTQVIPVGEIFLTADADNALAVEYTVNNITVTKQLVRQTFSQPLAPINYVGQFTLRQSLGDGSAPYGTRDFSAEVLLHLNDQGQGVLRTSESIDGLCDYRGPYKQEGRYGSFSGSYTCQSGLSGTFDVSNLEFTGQGVTALFNRTGADGVGRGRFAAVTR